ncbi:MULTISPECIES: class I SAM-dependent methyltransferase [unclassified Paenibacillus]|uniref:class I SAM-dependent methyltransferase n=1 Tax=unclassified Paenibacillus TaxID=185978 RepID=UPI0008C008F5|nr:MULTISPECIES: class I SAM-dependent methyltransferase [unclassified Paenibacillus]QLG38076.1 class I SAM-dependent methyltransferase [Paenibacillus sp. E222]SEO61831.1 methyltransferase, TIGR00027 family [Paenibacillus sp. OK076]
MKQNQSSITSLISAFGRAYHCQYDTPLIFNDYLAKALITPQEFADIRENMIQGIHFFNPDMAHLIKDDPDKILRWIVQTQLAPTPLARAAYCERVLLHELALGSTQYVILGAGLDTFALRHMELKNSLRIIEVDAPPTQQFKLSRLASLKQPVPLNLRFVAMDLTNKDSLPTLDEELSGEKSFLSLLGVSFYWTKEDLSELLRVLFTNLPSGSSIVFDYADEHLFETKGIYNRVDHMVQMAAAGGEPMKSGYAYVEMEALLDEAGLLIYEHLTPEAIHEQFFQNRTDHLMAFETIHFIHAVKK